MQFTNEELTVIFSMLQVCQSSIEMKKHNKTKNDILVLEKLKLISEKIKKYMEVK